MLEIGMLVKIVLQFHPRKEENAKHRKEHQEKEKKRSNIHKLWDGQKEGIENLLQIFSLVDQLEDSQDSERSHDSCQHAVIYIENVE